jgi:hypothetical protein
MAFYDAPERDAGCRGFLLCHRFFKFHRWRDRQRLPDVNEL